MADGLRVRRGAIRTLALLLLAVLLPVVALPVAAQSAAAQSAAAQSERILSFDATVTVRPDGVLHVVESIEVLATGEQIRRGIFRDFPTRRITARGFNHRAGFSVVRVERDGRPEPWSMAALTAGVRIYIGNPNALLPPGRHHYTIAYESSRQLLHRPGEDELYWNVTGDAWAFPIERAAATIGLPAGATASQIAAYTGPPGAVGNDFELRQRGGGTLRLATTRSLAPGEGFTVAVAWPEGAVARPNRSDAWRAFIGDNPGILLGYALTAALIVYFAVAWHRVGRDPARGTVIPLFEAPDRLSPVATGYVWNRGFGSGFRRAHALTVAITSLATARAVTIEDAGDGEFVVERLEGPPRPLSTGERAVLKALFDGGNRAVRFGGAYEPGLGAAAEALAAAVAGEYGRAYFHSNRGFWAIGLLLALAAIASSLLLDAGNEEDAGTVAVLALFAAAFTSVSCSALAAAGSRLFGPGPRSWRAIVLLLAGGGLALLPAAGTLTLITDFVAPAALVPLILTVPVTVAYWHLLAAPTRLGRRTLDAIEGYRLYLSVAEADRLDAAGREPAVTAALFERHLPYAMALGVETEWTEKVIARLGASTGDPDAARRSIEPGWFRSRDGGRIGATSLARSLSHGLGGAAAVASSRPSSSGASSGGGSSGGGGGGGGGGGW